MKQLLTVIAILLALSCCTTEADRTRMRASLDSINQCNRTGQPFTVRLVEPYVRFFDNHGTANDRLLAHYLLGRAYHEHGEAPMALQCYHDAIDCADTTAADCDFAQLARVYGQMAEVFYYQGLYRQQLLFEKLSVEYAWKGNDTLLALQNYEQECYAYNNLALQDSAILIVEDVASMYEQYGYSPDAAIALAGIVRPLINRREYQKAKNYMDIYETKSGLFDTDGNIEKGREIYYNVKGLYYLYNNKLDSAEYFFRKELHDGRDYNNQNAGANGLVLLYQRLHNTDSIAKYSLYAYAMSDSLYARKTAKEVERMQAMYDYTRHQQVARQEKEKAAKEKSKRQFVIAILILVMVLAIAIIYEMSVERKRKQEQHIRTLEALEQTQSEILLLRAHDKENEELLEIKVKQFEELRTQFQELKNKSLIDHASIDNQIRETDTYKKLLERQYGKKLTVEELRASRKLVLEYLPEFNGLLLSKEYRLNPKNFNLCILFRLGFKSKEVSNMLGLSPGRISQICSKLLRDVFKKDEGGATELMEILHELY